MPELSDVLETNAEVDKPSGTTAAAVVDVTTIDTETEMPETATTATTPAPADAKKKVTPKTPVKKPAVKKPVAKPTATKPASTGETGTETNETDEPSLRRPPMEQLTKDVERHILTLKIGDKPIKKLGYKCGKVIFGLENSNGKDFRVIAFKARKKTKSVAGKSRCIFYFGVSKDLTNLVKNHAGTSTTEFGSCSVQVKKPIQLILDKVTFAENFNQNIEKVMTVIKDLCTVTIEHKTEQWKTLTEKVEAKKKAAETKKTKVKDSATAADGE